MGVRVLLRPALALVAAVIAGGSIMVTASAAGAPLGPHEWTKYVHDNAGSGFSAQAGLTGTNAATLRLEPGWPVRLGGSISTQPLWAHGMLYVGAWDGYEYALDSTGAVVWRTFLGITTKGKACQYPIGVASTGVLGTETVGGSEKSVLYVGGGGNMDAAGQLTAAGQASLYALDARTGEVLWRTPLAPAPDGFMWSSPALFKHSVYVGVSAFADCPLIRGALVQVDARNGAVQHTFYSVPNRCTGGSIWGSPSIDEQSGVVYVATGNPERCSVFGSLVGTSLRPKPAMGSAALAVAGVLLSLFAWWRGFGRTALSAGAALAAIGLAGAVVFVVGPRITVGEPYAAAMIQLRASDLAVLGSWQVPPAEQTLDSDFGTTPTLFAGTAAPGGQMRRLVGAANKNGLYYVFDRGDISAGPVARLHLAGPGKDPTQGNGSIAPAAFDGSRLFVAGGSTTVDGRYFPGSLSAFDPNNLGKPVWQVGVTTGPVLGAVSAVPGLTVIGAGDSTLVYASADGALAFQGRTQSGAVRPAIFFGAPMLAGSVIVEGDSHGALYAYGLP